MILRREPIYLLSVLIYTLFHIVSAQDTDTFDCHIVLAGVTYDLTSLAGEHTVSRTRDTPPSSMLDSIRLNLCADLKVQDDVAEVDQCPAGTRVCLTKINKKADSSDRIVAVIPIAQTSLLQPEYTALSSPKGLSLILHGPSYPHPTTATLTPQFLNLTILCTPESTASDLEFTLYDNSQLQIKWSAQAGCGFKSEEGEKGGEDDSGKEEQRSVGSGVGWFFLVLLLAFAAYFALGAYYNYSTYGASGADLIPHRDFWKEVPYMLRDVASHLCSTVRPRHTSSRGGYIAV